MGGMTPGESALLSHVGTEAAPDDIRARIDRESAQLATDDRGLIERMMFWRELPPPGDVVNAGQESRRLPENAALGKPPPDGQTPRLEPKPIARNNIC